MSAIKVLVIGAGAREHALAWCLKQDPQISEVLLAPGNAGTAQEPGLRNVACGVSDLDSLLEIVRREQVGFTVVGPEAPLALGVVDRFRAAGHAIFGPTQAAAELESSKAYTKDFLARWQIPTARYAVYTEVAPALAYLRAQASPIVVKADGLAAGKGVVVARSLAEAEAAVVDMLGGSLGGAGARVVIEEFLAGVEASYMVIASGTDYVALPSSQDHKRVGAGDSGPNTGGMGAICPTPVVTPAIELRIQREIIEPTLRAMAAEGRSFTGFLYAGVMIDALGNPRTLEFNVRMGDPETQAILSRLRSPLLPVLQAAALGELARAAQLAWDARPAVAVVLCAEGYPGAVRKGDPISGLPQVTPNCRIFHAATRRQSEQLVTDGGRILTVVALGGDLLEAQQRAYQIAGSIRWTGMFMRPDIGWRALPATATGEPT